MASIFGSLDSGGPIEVHSFEEAKPRKMPLPNVWIDGPGGIQVNDTPWEEAHAEYKFVDEMEDIRYRLRENKRTNLNGIKSRTKKEVATV